MQVKEWLSNKSNIFDLEISQEQGNNSFITKTWHISDPHGGGLSFELTENETGEASMLDVGKYKFTRLNIAEGFSSDFILSIADRSVAGKIEAVRSLPLGRSVIKVKEPKSEMLAIGKAKLGEKAKIVAYTEKKN